MRVMRHPFRSSAGVGLIELMIGIAVGLILIAGLSSVYVNTVQGGRMTTSANQLNQEMRALMDIMVNDIRRAGYRAVGDTDATNNKFNLLANRPVISADRTCIQYSYDRPELGGDPGEVDVQDRFGFRLNGTVVQAVRPETGANCAGGTWDDLTDSITTVVTELTFDMAGSKCHAFWPADPASAPMSWESEPAKTVVCDPAAAASAAAFDPTKHAFIETRRVNITLVAHSVSDPVRVVTLRGSVLIRTNRTDNP